MSFGGGCCDKNFGGVVQVGYFKDITPTDREIILNWLNERSELTNIRVGEMIDLNTVTD